MGSLKSRIFNSFIFMIIFMMLCGVVYPLAITGFAQIFFKDKANGSIIQSEGIEYGSTLIGQSFTGSKYMWGRAMNVDVRPGISQGNRHKGFLYSSPSNLSPMSSKFLKAVNQRSKTIKKIHTEKAGVQIPSELVTCSGSGLDPHISPAAAEYQIERIARIRNMKTDDVKKIVEKCREGRFLSIFGEETINVVKVNLYLEGIII